MLAPEDIVAGSRIGLQAGAYVLGCFDTRITFYSQQIRALELAHALHHGHLLPAGARVAVIGGGAAGLTFAAGLALLDGTRIQLFEQAPDLLPIQSGTMRRRLDPHIYDWPALEADHELAQLPILDWRSGPAMVVREAVLREFDEIRPVVGDRLEVRTGHLVTAANPVGGRFFLTLERDNAAGGRESVQEEFDIVVLAIGFGIEPPFAIAGTDTASYWLDQGVPGAAIDGNPRPAFLVSGNGDGGLIDLIAAASATFSHDQIIRDIAQRPGVQALRDRLLAIDVQARAADAAGNGFDFQEAYDAEIGADVEALGLVDEVRRRLRPGVQLFFQTREPELLSIKTARLNRLAVYLLVKACEGDGPERFDHVVCDDLIAVPAQAGDAAGSRRFDCGGHVIRTDWVIARRGPGRPAIRAPFAALLAGHEADHTAWVLQFPDDSIAPELSPATRTRFERIARAAQLPPPRYQFEDVLAALPRSARISLVGGNARWTGDFAVGDIAEGWSTEAPILRLCVGDAPDALGAPLSHAIARLAIHAPRLELLADVARWSPFLSALSTASPSAAGLPLPTLRAVGGHPSILNPVTMAPDVLATTINNALDRWLLEAVDRHLARYLAHGDDPGHAVSFEAAADLRQQMLALWQEWVQLFHNNPGLLSRFLGLAVCAKDDPAAASEAAALAGRCLLPQLTRACAVALAVATAWQVTAPCGERPGNLRRDAAGTPRTGHACSAGLIDNEQMLLAALQHAWTTEFVLLPMQDVPLQLMAGANGSLARTDGGVPPLALPGLGGRLMLTVDRQFREAAKAGAAVLAALLNEIEEDHFRRLRAAIDTGSGEDL